MTAVALCFPGQGSQRAGMATGLDGPHIDRLQRVALDAGLDLGSALAGTDDELRPTQVAQPALLAVELALVMSLPHGVHVVGVAGHSVGEYAAAAAAGALDVDDAMRLVVARGRLMAAMRSGTMSAVLGLDAGDVAALCAEVVAAGRGDVVVANLNAPGQTVVSGDLDAVAEVEARARDRGARRTIRLNVSGAFHSPLMESAAHEFAELLDRTPLHDPSLPIVCNVDAAAVTTADELRPRLARQLTSAVRWTDCVERLVALGAELLVEVGPGSVLTGLARRIAPGLRAMTVDTAEQMRSLRQTADLAS